MRHVTKIDRCAFHLSVCESYFMPTNRYPCYRSARLCCFGNYQHRILICVLLSNLCPEWTLSLKRVDLSCLDPSESLEFPGTWVRRGKETESTAELWRQAKSDLNGFAVPDCLLMIDYQLSLAAQTPGEAFTPGEENISLAQMSESHFSIRFDSFFSGTHVLTTTGQGWYYLLHMCEHPWSKSYLGLAGSNSNAYHASRHD